MGWLVVVVALAVGCWDYRVRPGAAVVSWFFGANVMAVLIALPAYWPDRQTNSFRVSLALVLWLGAMLMIRSAYSRSKKPK